jgi:hypothetical protein
MMDTITNSDNSSVSTTSEKMQWEKPVLYTESWLKTMSGGAVGDSEGPYTTHTS